MRYSLPVPTPPSDSLLSPCVLVVKTPVAARKGMAGRLARSREGLAGEVADAAREQELTLAAVREALDSLGVTPALVSVDALNSQARRALGRARFVITVGGDGTLLAASHWVTRAGLLGVNSAPKSSVGYLTSTRRATVARDLARIAKGELLHPAGATAGRLGEGISVSPSFLLHER
jgi:ATP-NAD kinase